MDQSLALAVAVPLLAAAVITGLSPLLGERRRVLDALAIAVAAAVAVMLAVIMVRTAGGDQVYWFAGFGGSTASRSALTSRRGRSAPGWPRWPPSW